MENENEVEDALRGLVYQEFRRLWDVCIEDDARVDGLLPTGALSSAALSQLNHFFDEMVTVVLSSFNRLEELDPHELEADIANLERIIVDQEIILNSIRELLPQLNQ